MTLRPLSLRPQMPIGGRDDAATDMLCRLHDQISADDVDLVIATIDWHLMPEASFHPAITQQGVPRAALFPGRLPSQPDWDSNLFGCGLFDCR